MDVLTALIALVIGLVFLAGGIGIGIVLRTGRTREALPILSKVSTQYAAQLAETTNLAETAKGLNEACQQHQPQLPLSILRGADSVVKASSSLRKQMESLNQLMTTFQEARNRSAGAAASRQPQVTRDWSADERNLLQDKPAKTKEQDKSASATRLSFDLWQYVAAYDGQEYPEPNAFTLVHCTGSSSEGFSYFSKTSPTAEKLIVAVGSPSSLQFFLAEILQTRRADVDGEAGHVTACLFLQKVAGVYRWDNTQCRIALDLEAATA
jgi:hypothetical protein